MSVRSHTTSSGKGFKNALCLSDGIYKTPHLAQLTGAQEHQSTKGINNAWVIKNFFGPDLIVDWGNKRYEMTSKLSAVTNIPVLSLEDGFIRSLRLGVEGSRPFSIVSDWTGIYYDALRPSDLENILNNKDSRSSQIPGLRDRSHKCIQQIINSEISKYNQAPDYDLGPKEQKRILLVDQTAGDLSISGGMASSASFRSMLNDALNQDAELIVKVHPDVLTGKKQGNIDLKSLPQKTRLVSKPSNPLDLIKQVDEIWVATSLMGFEACMAGKTVRCYGMPFYAGWGITKDMQQCPRRSTKRTVEEVFAAAYLLYASYFDPLSGELTELEAVLDHIERQKKIWNQNRKHFICLGFDRWKHLHVRKYLASDENQVEFKSSLEPSDFKENTQILVWGNNTKNEYIDLAQKHQIPVGRMEDGFIRSMNLGKYGVLPRSLVVDLGGIYYDPASPSDLETILSETTFSPEELQAASNLQNIIVSGGLSKYNVGSTSPVKTNARKDQRIILVPGQVGIDASIKKGCDLVDSNIKLLEAVRDKNPEAYILFKPHPDVVSGNTKESADYLSFANQIEEKAHIHSCLQIVDEVHTMTSLVGFEALLRSISVHTYGRPFYAGWGLTKDHSSLDMPRRIRQLTKEELIAGVYLRYPRYIDPETGEFTSAVQTAKALNEEVQQKGTARLSKNPLKRWLLKARYGGWGTILSLFQ